MREPSRTDPVLPSRTNDSGDVGSGRVGADGGPLGRDDLGGPAEPGGVVAGLGAAGHPKVGSPRAGSEPSRLVFVRAGRLPYEVAWAEQRRLHAARIAGEVPDTVLLLEHPSVYTAGRRTEAWERPVDGTPVIDVDRGGKITWHGPGQLVGYPILALPVPADVVAYVRRLEAVLIGACADLGLGTTRVAGRSGVWVPADDRGPARKVAAIGIRVSRGVTMHGFALNCDPDLTAFDRIVACGIADAGVTSLTAELGWPVGVADAVDVVESALRRGGLTAPAAAVGATAALPAAR
jgi:lipoyl(octanoyl) transferase